MIGLPMSGTNRRAKRPVLLATILSACAFFAGCVPLPPVGFRAEAAALKAEAASRFAPGTPAARFETWFLAKAGSDAMRSPPGGNADRAGREEREITLRRFEGRANLLTARYRVDAGGRLETVALRGNGLLLTPCAHRQSGNRRRRSVRTLS